MVNSHLPQGLESPEGLRTSTSPIVYILPRIEIKKFILLRMGCFQLSPLGARLWCYLISFFLMICLHQDLTYPLGSLWKETQSQWALQWLGVYFQSKQDDGQDWMKTSHIGWAPPWHFQPMFQALARPLRGQMEQSTTIVALVTRAWNGQLPFTTP